LTDKLSPETTRVKLFDINVWEGGLLTSQLFDFLVAEDPDVLCLQEVFDGKDVDLPANFRSIQVLQQHFPQHAIYFSPEMLCITNVGKIELGNLIMSRFPIVHSSTQFFDIPYGEYEQKPASNDWSQDPCNIQHCQLAVGNKTLNVFNLHGIWGIDGGDTPRRLHMSRVVVTNVQDKTTTVLTGDFNVKPDTETIRNIETQLANVFAGQLATSFNLPRKDLSSKRGYATAVVDMMFVSQDLTVTEHYCPQVDVSDHLPLICVIEV